MKLFTNSALRRLALTSAFAILLAGAGCNPTNVEPIEDPNSPSIDSVLNPTQAQINAQAVGVEAILRLGHTNNAANNQILGVLGREVMVLTSNEPRWSAEILGTTRADLDNSSFYGLGSYNAFARTIRAAKLFRLSAASASADVLTDVKKQAVYGFCDTYEALAKIYLLNLMGDNGIRVDVDDIFKPGKFVGPAVALASIRQLLDRGNTELLAGGTAFPFSLSAGYAGFSTPPTFSRFNRALAARVTLYQGKYDPAKYAEVVSLLPSTFYSTTSATTVALGVGPKITFNPAAAGDQGNTYFQRINNGNPVTLIAVPDAFVTEAEAGDTRVNKVNRRVAPAAPPKTVNGITGVYESALVQVNTQSLDIIRNEELVLISSEAKANSGDLAGALEDINVIRTSSGLQALTATAPRLVGGLPDYINEILRQRRYSLFYQGHLLVDLRRLNKLNTNPVPGYTLAYSQGTAANGGTYKLFPELRKPQAEEAWDQANP